MEIEISDWYQAMIEDLAAIQTEAVFTSRWSLVEGYWHIGKRIREEVNLQREEIYGQKILPRVAESLGMRERLLYQCIQFFDKYPDLNAVPEGKNISWHKITNKYLPAPEKEPHEHIWELWEICRVCKAKRKVEP